MSNKKKGKDEDNKKILPSSYTKKSKDFKLLNYSFKVDEYGMRGLNKYRSFMSAPLCECCNEPAPLLIEDEEELDRFCYTVLYENGWNNSAIFLVYRDGRQKIVYTETDYYEDDEVENCEYISGISSMYVEGNDQFAIFDADMGLRCYSLMIEKEKGVWTVEE